MKLLRSSKFNPIEQKIFLVSGVIAQPNFPSISIVTEKGGRDISWLRTLFQL